MSNFPKMVYRAAGAKIENRIVADEDAMSAAGAEGWGELAVAKANAKAADAPAVTRPVGVPSAKPDKPDPAIAQLQLALTAEREAGESARALAHAAEQVAEAHLARAQQYEAFLIGLRDDENAPEPLRAAIAELLGDGTPQASAPAKNAAKAKAKPKAQA